jgi:uncharacterized coiled-coil protein SlyX
MPAHVSSTALFALLLVGCIPPAVLEDVDARLDALEASASANADLSELTAKVEALQTDVARLQADVDALSSTGTSSDVTEALDALGTADANLSDTLAALSGEVAVLTGDVDALQDDLVNGRIFANTYAPNSTTNIPPGSGTTVLDSTTFMVPAPGTLIAILTGNAIFFSEGTTLDVGLADTAFDLDFLTDIGNLDGNASERFTQNFTVMAKYDVPPGPFELFSLATTNPVFDAGQVNVTPQQLTILFVPDTP